MKQIADPCRIVGIGSPHGNDQVGWLVASRLAQRPGLRAGIRSVAEPSLLWREMDASCRRLVIVDAMQSGAPRGTILRFKWPDCRITDRRTISSHGIGLATVLKLAEQLGRLPESVILFGLEIGESQLEPLVQSDLERSLVDLENEICRVIP